VIFIIISEPIVVEKPKKKLSPVEADGLDRGKLENETREREREREREGRRVAASLNFR